MKTTAIIVGLVLGTWGLVGGYLLIRDRHNSVAPRTIGIVSLVGMMSSAIVLTLAIATMAE